MSVFNKTNYPPTTPEPTDIVLLGKADGTTASALVSDLSGVQNYTRSIATLKALDTTLVGAGYTVQVLGYYAAGDGGGGVFYWDAGATDADNGGTIIQPNAGGDGRWMRVYSGAVNVKWFGAMGDGVTDDYTAIQAAIDAAISVVIPEGIYMIGTGILLRSNQDIFGDGNATVLKAKTNAISVLSASGKSNISIRNLSIDGGGQTAGIYAGIRGVVGILLNATNYFVIDNVRVVKCGVSHSGAPTDDANYGGMGIVVSATAGASGFGEIKNCVIQDIAGGGNYKGDGIYIGGDNASPLITTKSVNVSSCWVSVCGRHCFTVAGGSGSSVPSNININGCYGEKSALCGIDFEDGYNSAVLNTVFSACGNDQTYYDPATIYGSTYRLMAGVAVGNNDINIVISGCNIAGCYYGITYGALDGFVVCSTTIQSSTVSDLLNSLAAGPRKFRMTNVTCRTATGFLLTYSSTANDTEIVACEFAGLVKVSGTLGIVFNSCVFRAGFQINGAGVECITWDSCTFTDFAGAGISFANDGYDAKDCAVLGCRFLGTGNMTYGISFRYDSASRWKIENNLFIGLAAAGIGQSNSNAGKTFVSSVQNNSFKSCANGFVVTQQGLKNSIIAGNFFEAITGWCIDFTAINFGGVFTGVIIASNVSGGSVVNGVRIEKGTGDGDYVNIIGNNLHSCSGTKANINITNANGNNVNNIIT